MLWIVDSREPIILSPSRTKQCHPSIEHGLIPLNISRMNTSFGVKTIDPTGSDTETNRHSAERTVSREEYERVLRLNGGMARLVQAVQELSLARDLNTIMAIVRRAAREMTQADGATFVLRDGNNCYYADEDAIAPLWKGQRFPLDACISGWSMVHGQTAVIEDIYSDPRIPAVAYRETFVKSLVMVPIRTQSPIGAIGNYWAERQFPTKEKVELLQALVNTTAVAMENVQVYTELEKRVCERTAQWEAAHRELEAFSYSVSHDLRAPLRAIRGFAGILKNQFGKELPEEATFFVDRIVSNGADMSDIIEGLLQLSQLGRKEIEKEKIEMATLVRGVVETLQKEQNALRVEVEIGDLPDCHGDAAQLRQVFVNLLSNAFKFTRQKEAPRIKVGFAQKNGERAYFVQDNGAGFAMEHAHKLFRVFQRLHAREQFPGSGIGLSIVQRIVQRHGGKVWAEAAEDQGATFWFTLAA
jgi:signal transduction histidine kinase